MITAQHESSGFSSTLDAALLYADRGWPVFPCREDKTPHTEHGFHDATVDHEKIVAWWRRWPDAQIGIACGAAGICVIDLDLGKGKDGIAAFSRLKDEHGPDWCALVATTPRGGRHYVYLMPAEPIGCSTDIIPGSGIDVRGGGGYIVAPSPSSPGREWSIGDPFEVDDDGSASLTQMPDWVEALARGGRRAHTSTGGSKTGGESTVEMPLPPEQVAAIRRALQFIDSDPRDTWIRVGMALKSTGARDQAYELWDEWSATSHRYAGFDKRKHEHQWDSIREFRMDGSEVTIATLFHLAQQGGYVATAEEQAAETAIESPPQAGPPAPVPLAKRPFPRELMNVPGLLGDIAAWMVASSRRQQPAMCLASAIVTLGAVLGRRVATETDLRTNCYALGIGETACGKDPSVKLPALLLTRAGLQWAIGPGEWKSDSGLRAALIDNPSHAAYVDEFTKLLDQMSGNNVAGYVKGIKKHLLEMWAASNSIHLSVAQANRQLNKPVIIEQPNLCVYGVGVPSELFSSLDRGAVSDGFLNRMLIFFADEQQPPVQKIGRAEPPEELVKQLQELAAATELGNLAGLSTAAPNARMVPYEDAASAMMEQLDQGNDARIAAMRAKGDPLAELWVRFSAHVAKMSLIRSVSDDPTRKISVHDVSWAVDLVSWCLERTMAEAESRVADNQHEALTKRVLRLINEAGPTGIVASDLTRKTQWLRKGDRKDILSTLVDSKQAVTETTEIERAGRGPISKVTYWAAHHRADLVQSDCEPTAEAAPAELAEASA